MRGRFSLGGVVAVLTAALLLPGTAAQAKGPEIGGTGSTSPTPSTAAPPTAPSPRHER